MERETRSEATDHIAAAWAMIDDGDYGRCLQNLDAAAELVRAEVKRRTARPLPVLTKPAPVPRWEPKPRKPRSDRKPVESPDEWWEDAKAAGEALHVAPNSVKNVCSGSHSYNTVGGVRVWYSKFRTRQAWEAARQRQEVAA